MALPVRIDVPSGMWAWSGASPRISASLGGLEALSPRALPGTSFGVGDDYERQLRSLNLGGMSPGPSFNMPSSSEMAELLKELMAQGVGRRDRANGQGQGQDLGQLAQFLGQVASMMSSFAQQQGQGQNSGQGEPSQRRSQVSSRRSVSDQSAERTQRSAPEERARARRRDPNPDARVTPAEPTRDTHATPGDGVGGRVIESQGTRAAIRRGAITPRLKAQLATAGRETGLNAEVVSGGQPSHGRNRTGSHRHDHGNAADITLRDARTGRLLDMRNPADAQRMAKFTEVAVREGATGVGAGPGYMGYHTLHIGGGTPATWGGAPWIRGAWQRGMNARR